MPLRGAVENLGHALDFSSGCFPIELGSWYLRRIACLDKLLFIVRSCTRSMWRGRHGAPWGYRAGVCARAAGGGLQGQEPPEHKVGDWVVMQPRMRGKKEGKIRWAMVLQTHNVCWGHGRHAWCPLDQICIELNTPAHWR